MAFGHGVEKSHRVRASTIHYPVEIEIGSDFWSISRDEELILDSNFVNLSDARDILREIIVGSVVEGARIDREESLILLDGGLT